MSATAPASLAEELRREGGVDAARCYQCGKCSAGCPLSAEADFPPSAVLRMLQTGAREWEDRALGALMPWLCLGCHTCSCRCPMEVDLPRAMDFLRVKSLERDRVHPEADAILAFHRAFLDTLEGAGRLREIGLTMRFKMRTGRLFQDLTLAPVLLFKGRLPLLHEKMEGREAVAGIFLKTARAPEKNG